MELLAIHTGGGKSDVQQSMEISRIKYRVLLDKEYEVSGLYGVDFAPVYIIIDIDGRILYRDVSIPSEELIESFI